MGLLSGSASVTRFDVIKMPEEPDFAAASFTEIQPGSQVFERIGFVPFEPEAPYQVGQHRWAFRVRIDRLRPDPTAVQERLKELLLVERETTGRSYVSAKKRKKLRELAQEELIVRAAPRSKVIECCIDGAVLHVASTAKAYLGMVLALLRQIEIVCDFKAPWLDRDESQVHSELVEALEPWQSALGCRFLKALLEDPEILFEPESGSVQLRTRDAKIGLSGAVLNDLHRYVSEGGPGGAELLSAKLVYEQLTFRLDALNFRVNGLSFETEPHDTWIELLDERLEQINAVWDLLDRRYESLSPKLHSEAFA